MRKLLVAMVLLFAFAVGIGVGITSVAPNAYACSCGGICWDGVTPYGGGGNPCNDRLCGAIECPPME